MYSSLSQQSRCSWNVAAESKRWRQEMSTHRLVRAGGWSTCLTCLTWSSLCVKVGPHNNRERGRDVSECMWLPERVPTTAPKLTQRFLRSLMTLMGGGAQDFQGDRLQKSHYALFHDRNFSPEPGTVSKTGFHQTKFCFFRCCLYVWGIIKGTTCLKVEWGSGLVSNKNTHSQDSPRSWSVQIICMTKVWFNAETRELNCTGGRS